MTSVIHRNRLSWHSSAEDCSGTSRFICLQLGDHKTEGASRLLIFCFFSKPSSVQGLGVTRWMDNLDETPSNFPERRPKTSSNDRGCPGQARRASLPELRTSLRPTKEPVFPALPRDGQWGSDER